MSACFSQQFNCAFIIGWLNRCFTLCYMHELPEITSEDAKVLCKLHYFTTGSDDLTVCIEFSELCTEHQHM